MTRAWRWGALLLIGALAIRQTTDTDLWWHLRTGQLILTDGLPRTDPFSFTAADHLWIVHQWLADLLLWLLYDVAGLVGLSLFFAIVVVATFGLVAARLPGWPWPALPVLLLAAAATRFVWGARPQLFNMLLAAAFVYLLEGVRRGVLRRRALAWLPPLAALWANLHSGFLLGIAILTAYTIGAALDQRRRAAELLVQPTAWAWGGVTAVSLLAGLLNPYGARQLLFPLGTLSSNAIRSNILEWRSPDFHGLDGWLFGALLLAGVLGWVYGQRPETHEVLLFFGAAAAGLVSVRHIPLFAIVATPGIARAWSGWSLPTWLHRLVDRFAPLARPALLGGLLLLALLAGWRASIRLQDNEAAIARKFPVAAVQYLSEAGLAGQRGYNSYNWGGYLIWRGVPVFVDGRTELYGDALFEQYLSTYRVESDWATPLAAWSIDYVVVEAGAPLATLLSVTPGWALVYEDDLAVIYVRKSAQPAVPGPTGHAVVEQAWLNWSP